MKKITALLLVLVFALCLPLASCVHTLENPQPQTPVIPKGYLEYNNEKISFAYPEGWVVNDGSVVIIVNESGVGNNITVSYEQFSDMYSTMTAETFNTTLKPMFAAAGLSVSNATVEQVENDVSTKITKITYTAAANGVTMKQTMFICAAGDRNYIVTVTETTGDPQLVNTVFDTLYVK
ncbi:MAG: hypothetical protein J6W15_01350 [Clostridia bacterium]|nr:hypothetical protein [Clostridia bacterium]MBO7245214.1 hypothetical protein [Clostridia bacterium]